MPGKPVELDPSARDEAQEAYRWYLDRSPRAAAAFIYELDQAIGAISEAPSRFGEYLHGCRRRLLNRYPYLVVYRERGESIQVVAVAHGRRRPGYWRDRLT